MICLVCRQAELVDGLTSAVFERGEVKVEITSIPARVCPGCGDAVVEEKVAMDLMQGMEDLSRSGIKEANREFRRLQPK